MLIRKVESYEETPVQSQTNVDLNEIFWRLRAYKSIYPVFPSALETARYFHDNASPTLKKMYPGKIVDHESYLICNCAEAIWIRERMNKEPMDEEIRISGPFANMSEDDYRTIFNHHVNVVKKMSNEELLLHRLKLQKAIKQLRIRDLAAHETENERIADMDRNEREEYRKKSLSYKPKPPVEDEKTPRVRRNVQSPEDKAVKALMGALGMTEEEAREYIRNKKAGGN